MSNADVARPELVAEPMIENHRPGWEVDTHACADPETCGDEPDDDNGCSYMLWAPRTAAEARERGNFPGLARERWAAAWTMNGGRDGGFVRADSPAAALAVFGSCPLREEAARATAALLDAAAEWQASRG